MSYFWKVFYFWKIFSLTYSSRLTRFSSVLYIVILLIFDLCLFFPDEKSVINTSLCPCRQCVSPLWLTLRMSFIFIPVVMYPSVIFFPTKFLKMLAIIFSNSFLPQSLSLLLLDSSSMYVTLCDIVPEATKTLVWLQNIFLLVSEWIISINFSSGLLIFLLQYLICCLAHQRIFHFKYCVFSSRICSFIASVSLTRFSKVLLW